MCGINGLVDFRNQISNKKEIVATMNQTISYRGPDAQTLFHDTVVGFGQCRLSIIDLATGGQPIFNEDRSKMIIFNGEIYDYQGLQQDLLRLGHTLSTQSDTEVILHLYESFGAKCLEKLNGMFAFAIWDFNKQELFIARDRLGIKPLCYAFEKGNFLFSSEEKPLIQSDLIPRVLNRQSIEEFLELSYIPAPNSIYSSIHKLKPGHYLVYSRQGIKIQSWWQVPQIQEERMGYDEAKNQLRASLIASVKRRMVADVKVGCFLSGGIDSTIITGIASRCSTEKLRTFSVGYEDNHLYDESALAAKIAAFHKTEHTPFYLSEKAFIQAIPDVLDSMGEPFGDSSILPVYLISKLAKQQVKVALSGDGADELFGGYNKYLLNFYQDKYPNWALKILKSGMKFLPDGRNGIVLEKMRQMKKMLSSMDTTLYQQHFNLSNSMRNMSAMKSGQSLHYFKEIYKDFKGIDRINQQLRCDIMHSLPGDMLKKVDNGSMRASLEVRVPFLDHTVVELALKLPSEYKINKSQRKKILKESFLDYIPETILSQKKRGFEVPVSEWLKTELKPLFMDLIHSDSLEVVNKAALLAVYEDHCSNKKNSDQFLWNVFVLLYFLQKK